MRLALLLILVALAACQAPTPSSGGDLVLEYHISGGFAPVEDAWLIYSDGRVIYRDLLQNREEERQISADAVASLVALMEAEGFFSFADSYLPENTCCDRRIYEITFHLGDRIKTISTIDGAEGEPAGLQRILQELNRLLYELP